MPQDEQAPAPQEPVFSFFKGADDIIAPGEASPFDWDRAATKVREHLNDAMSAKNVAFLLGSGCSSRQVGGEQLGIPTMKPMADTFVTTVGENGDQHFLTDDEFESLKTQLGLDVTQDEYAQNLERLMEVLYSFQFVLERSDKDELKDALGTVQSAITKVTRYILHTCTTGVFADGDETIFDLY